MALVLLTLNEPIVSWEKCVGSAAVVLIHDWCRSQSSVGLQAITINSCYLLLLAQLGHFARPIGEADIDSHSFGVRTRTAAAACP